MTTKEIQVDVLILGGGIAGLWTLARLRKQGYSCLLLETRALGSGQTIASQGIIHGGVKYQLAGGATDASKAIAEMPGIWRACLEGRGEVDLRDAKILSEHQYLWTAPGLLGRLAGFGASVAMRADVRRLEATERPAAFAHAPKGIDIYRVDEPVLDSRSVIEALARPLASCCCTPEYLDYLVFESTQPGGVPGLRFFDGKGANVLVRAEAIVFAAGEDNERLMQTTSMRPDMLKGQVRPLHMVMLRGAPHELHAHCVGASSLPRLTITSARDASGSWTWYIGGGLAENEGVQRDETAQIAETRSLLRDCLPWLDLSRTQLSTLRINRAEGVPVTQQQATRPDGPTVASIMNVVVAWPTKLAFAPLLAKLVSEKVATMGIKPRGTEVPVWPAEVLRPASIAPRPWESPEVRWT